MQMHMLAHICTCLNAYAKAHADSQQMRDRSDHLGAFSATRDGKRLNMLGFNTHLLDRDSAVPGNRNLG